MREKEEAVKNSSGAVGWSRCWGEGDREAKVGKMQAEHVRGGQINRLIWVPDSVEPCEPWKQ